MGQVAWRHEEFRARRGEFGREH
ncbi:Protein of unknown function [Propionibacterium freudenreichii]|nr:Protein of unknown function [Propionibacterium freudenreichii]CEG92216.1 Protein of unknown function [Propionibacterium freudenreichii]CEG95628.1 Protein of unknown function [Propionibacterium freudenreichii]CEH00013.1 Protein of unknown function [Propionibacterium freudenreichii]CEH08301.1 Protein of unknown function [Propionibacterium freudenreichii]